jgi:hypothetical protein
VEETAIEQGESENAEDESRRETRRQRCRVRDEVAERKYVADFTAKVLALFPGAPRQSAEPSVPARNTAGVSGDQSKLRRSMRRRSRSRYGPTCDTSSRSTTGFSPRVWSLSMREPVFDRPSSGYCSMERRAQRLRGRQGGRATRPGDNGHYDHAEDGRQGGKCDLGRHLWQAAAGRGVGSPADAL